MRPALRIAVACLILTITSSAQAQINITAGSMDLNVFNSFGSDSDNVPAPGSLNNAVSVGTPTLGLPYAEATMNASISTSSISGSGSTTIYNTGPPDPNGAHSVLDLEFEIQSGGYTQAVVSYTLDAPDVPALLGDVTNVSDISILGSGLGVLLADSVAFGSGSSSQTGLLNLPSGNYALTVSSEAGQSGFDNGAEIVTASWELDIQFNTGQTQLDPLLPFPNGGSWLFQGVPGSLWFDPVLASGFEFEMLSGAEFTEAGMPVGLGDIDGYTLVYMDGLSLVTVDVDAGDVYNFPAGVTSFKVIDIDPHFDPDDPLAFPIFLDYSTPLADFSMTPIPVPEPGSLFLLALGALMLPAWRHWRRPPRCR